MKKLLIILLCALFSFSTNAQATLGNPEDADYGESTIASGALKVSSCNGAEEVISQVSQNAPMAAFGQTDLAQSIIATTNIISGARVYTFLGFGIPAASDEIIISFYDNLPNNGGVLLASGSSFGDGISSVFDVCWPDLAVTIGATYFLVFTVDGDQGLAVAGDTNNPYPDGQVYANPGYTPFPNFDYTFEVFGNTTTVPTLSQWGIIILGIFMACLGVLAIRQRQWIPA